MNISPARLALWTVCVVAAMLGLGAAMPNWLLFLFTMAFANSLVCFGIVLLMRGGVVAFGQGLMSAMGGYAAALLFNKWGWTDGPLLMLAGGVVSAVLTAPFAPLLSRYRGIFFSMLTLALSMVGYGILVKTESLGGSDGFNLGRVSFFGQKVGDAWVNLALYGFSLCAVACAAFFSRMYFQSTRGLILQAIRDNELRVEYLGGSVRQTMSQGFVLAAFVGGCGGAMLVMALGHIDPNFSYWTTSGEFVFVAILAGTQSVLAIVLSSVILETVRSFSSAYFPNTWQLVLGLFLLFVIRFLPLGLGSLWHKKNQGNKA